MSEVFESEQKKRNVAYKLRIGDIMKSKPITADGKFLFLELGDKKISRVNVIANAVEKYIQNGEKKFGSITIDDASGQIRLKVFGDGLPLLEKAAQGDTLQVIGVVREYNSELYILPEVVKPVDTKWLLVRKLELDKQRKDVPLPKNAPIRDLILEKIKKADETGGADIEKLIIEMDTSSDIVNGEVKKLLEDGMIYEPRPGRLRYLG